MDGHATVVLASGLLATVCATRNSYSEETAELFEHATVAKAISGSSGFVMEECAGWQTYNFEVETFHTYVAGGVRVHNDSIF